MNPVEQKNRELSIDTKVKGLYAMLVRATELAALSSFQVIALLDTLEEKGIIDKKEVMEHANNMSGPSLQTIRDMAYYAEEDLEKETTQTPQTEQPQSNPQKPVVS